MKLNKIQINSLASGLRPKYKTRAKKTVKDAAKSSNHEVWRTCNSCGEESDARKSPYCSNCGAYLI